MGVKREKSELRGVLAGRRGARRPLQSAESARAAAKAELWGVGVQQGRARCGEKAQETAALPLDNLAALALKEKHDVSPRGGGGPPRRPVCWSERGARGAWKNPTARLRGAGLQGGGSRLDSSGGSPRRPCSVPDLLARLLRPGLCCLRSDVIEHGIHPYRAGR